jgi:flagellar protein FlbD
MINLTRLNHKNVVVNADLIESIDTTPDTLINLTVGHTMLVLESPEEIIRKVVNYKRDCNQRFGAAFHSVDAHGLKEVTRG